MTKLGRNQPCPCGSGKKYKRCCLRRDQAEARREDTKTPSPPPAEADALPTDEDLDQLDERSNRVITLINAGRLDEAETAAHDLLVRYPGFMDGHLRLAMISEARDQSELAAEHYRRAAACLDDECAELRADFLQQAERLAPGR